MKLLAFAASNSSTSINKQLVTYAAQLVENAQVTVLDLNDYEMPLYSSDREVALGVPEQAQAFYRIIGESDAVVIAFAEHNGSYSAAYKNLFDWTSRIDRAVYQNKPMVLLGTSPGSGGAANVLKMAVTAMPYFAGNVVGHLSVPKFGEHFDTGAGQLTNSELDQALRQEMSKLSTPN